MLQSEHKIRTLRKYHTVSLSGSNPNIDSIKPDIIQKHENELNSLIKINNAVNDDINPKEIIETNEEPLKDSIEKSPSNHKDEEQHQHSFESLIAALTKEKKSLHDAKIIYDYVKDLSFFNNFKETLAVNADNDALLELCKSLKYEKLRKGMFVFREGDLSNDKLYIILSGCITIYKNKNNNFFHFQNIGTFKSDHDDSFQLDQDITSIQMKESQIYRNTQPRHQTTILKNDWNSSSYQQRSTINLKSSATQEAIQISKSLKILPIGVGTKMQKSSSTLLGFKDNDINTNPSPSMNLDEASCILGYEIDHLKKGEMFGDKAITSSEKFPKRSTSIYTYTDCEFLILLKEDFSLIMNKYDREKQEKYRYIKENIPYLDNLASNTMDDYFYKFRTERFTSNTKLTIEGDMNDKIYFIYQGECILSKQIDLTQYYHDQQHQNQNHQLHHQSPHQFLEKKQKLPYPIKTNIAISKAGQGTIIGDEIVYERTKTYYYTATVITSDLLAFSFSKKDFLEWLPYDTRMELRKKFIEKEKFHNEKLNDFIDKRFSNIKQYNHDVKEFFDSFNLTHSSCKSAFISQLKRNKPLSFGNERQFPLTKANSALQSPKNPTLLEVSDALCPPLPLPSYHNSNNNQMNNYVLPENLSINSPGKQIAMADSAIGFDTPFNSEVFKQGVNNGSIYISKTPHTNVTMNFNPNDIIIAQIPKKNVLSTKEKPQISTLNLKTSQSQQQPQSLTELFSERGFSNDKITMPTLPSDISRKIDNGIINYLDNVKKLLKLEKNDPCKGNPENDKFDFGSNESELEKKRRKLLQAKRLNLKNPDNNTNTNTNTNNNNNNNEGLLTIGTTHVIKSIEDDIRSNFRLITHSKKKTELFTKNYKKYLSEQLGLSTKNNITNTIINNHNTHNNTITTNNHSHTTNHLIPITLNFLPTSKTPEPFSCISQSPIQLLPIEYYSDKKSSCGNCTVHPTLKSLPNLPDDTRSTCLESKSTQNEIKFTYSETKLVPSEQKLTCSDYKLASFDSKTGYYDPKSAYLNNKQGYPDNTKPANPELKPVNPDLKPANPDLKPTHFNFKPAHLDLKSVYLNSKSAYPEGIKPVHFDFKVVHPESTRSTHPSFKPAHPDSKVVNSESTRSPRPDLKPIYLDGMKLVHPESTKSPHPDFKLAYPEGLKLVHSESLKLVSPESLKPVHPESLKPIHPESLKSVHPESLMQKHPKIIQSKSFHCIFPHQGLHQGHYPQSNISLANEIQQSGEISPTILRSIREHNNSNGNADGKTSNALAHYRRVSSSTGLLNLYNTNVTVNGRATMTTISNGGPSGLGSPGSGASSGHNGHLHDQMKRNDTTNYFYQTLSKKKLWNDKVHQKIRLSDN